MKLLLRLFRFEVLAVALLCSASAGAQVVASDIAVIQDTDGKIMEAVAMPDAYLGAASKKFFETHQDRYDAIFVYSAINLDMLSNTQQGWPVISSTRGIGRDKLYNLTRAFGSMSGRLRQAVKMGAINTMPDDPDATYTGLPLWNGLTGVELVAHEFGHHWLASIIFKTSDGKRHCMSRGFAPTTSDGGLPEPGDCDGYQENDFNQHWSYYFNSRSLMYGMFYEETGPGKFKIWYDQPKYSELDQYLMGLRSPGDVPPMFALLDADGYIGMGSDAMPSRIKYSNAKEVTGTRFDFTIADVIRENGERWPTQERCHWKAAVIVVANPMNQATPKMIDKMVRYANRWEEFYSYATDGRGSMDLTIDGRGGGTESCPSGTGPITPVDPGPEAMPDNAEDSGVLPDDSGPSDHGPTLPDWSHIDFGGESATTDTALPPRDGTAEDLQAEGDMQDSGTCTPGTLQCYGNMIQKCALGGKTWTNVRSCFDSGQVCIGDGTCDESGRKGGGCAAGPLTPGATGTLLLGIVLTLMALASRRRIPGISRRKQAV